MMTTALTTPQLIAGDHINTDDFGYVSAAQAGTEHAQRNVGDDRVLGAITVVETCGRRLALSTDTHRLHASAVSAQLPEGVYSPALRYRRDPALSQDQWLDAVRRLLDDLQQPDKPHAIELRVAQNHRERLLDIISRYPRSVVAFRTRAITVHDFDTDELLDRIDRARALSDRLRRHKLVTIRASVLRRPLVERVLVFTGRNQMSPVIGYRRQRLAVLMPAPPSTAVASFWDSAGEAVVTT